MWQQPTAAAEEEEGEVVRQTRAAEAAVVEEEEASRAEVGVAIDGVVEWAMLRAASALEAWSVEDRGKMTPQPVNNAGERVRQS